MIGTPGAQMNGPAASKNGPAGTARGYQALLVTLLSLNFGILFFDRNALAFLMPFVQPDLALSNTQVGLAASSLSFSWALAALFIGAAADKVGKRKAFLIGATLAFSVCSFVTGTAVSFAMLLGARLLMGAAEGGVAPISQTITALAVRPERRGLAMGVMQNFGSNLFGSFVAPVVLVGFATAFGWRRAFFLAGVPGLVSAALLWFVVREPPPAAHGAAVTERLATRLRHILQQRNMPLCIAISVLLVAYLVTCWTFAPLFLTRVRGFSAGTMSWLMGTLGISATVGSFVVSGISDRIGRKPVMICISYLGVILPLGAMFFGGSTWALASIFFFGWALTGLFPLFMGTIPSETVDPHLMTTAMALVMGAGEVIGGALSPTIAGWAADRAGLAAPMWIMLGLCVTAGTLALGLTETAPARRQGAIGAGGASSVADG